jgi:hypothetical protein
LLHDGSCGVVVGELLQIGKGRKCDHEEISLNGLIEGDDSGKWGEGAKAFI